MCSVCRYHHSAVCVPANRAMYVFGGLLNEGAAADSVLWKYDIRQAAWYQIEVTSLNRAQQFHAVILQSAASARYQINICEHEVDRDQAISVIKFRLGFRLGFRPRVSSYQSHQVHT